MASIPLRAGALWLPIALCAALAQPAPPSGKELFARRCGGCHALAIDKTGPRLRGVYGRAAASVKGFAYSGPLRASHIVWNAAALDDWLADTDRFVPGSDMSFRVEDARERAVIIEYLKDNPDRP